MTKSESIAARPSGQDIESGGRSIPEDFDRWAEHDAVKAIESTAEDVGIPRWAIDGGFAPYILAARYFATEGEWPDGIAPWHPSFEDTPVWQINWIKGQKDPAAYKARRNRRDKRRKERARHTQKMADPQVRRQWLKENGPRRRAAERRNEARHELATQIVLPAEE